MSPRDPALLSWRAEGEEPLSAVSLEQQVKFGDRVVHADKPEWGVGVVNAAVPQIQDGKHCQRVTVRFERAGLKTLSTAFAHLKPAEDSPAIEQAIMTSKGDWLSDVGAKQVQDIMTKLPENAEDPFASIESRLKATLGLYRFSPSGGALIDWAAAQCGLKDPLSRFSRHELEEFYRRFEVSREQHLRRLLGEAQRLEPKIVPGLLANAPEAAQRAVRKSDPR